MRQPRTRKGQRGESAGAGNGDRAVPDAGPLHLSPGKRVGDICFECECRILEIGGPDGMLLAWCECGWPDDHGEMQVS